ncbi:MAG: hypothetical protein JWP27_2396 [Flaviaesturariibacter sp.]|nr:hypothetical protein [Flaviaesturariibacter sp.]
MKALFLAGSLCAAAIAQAQDVSGLYTGTLFNDTTRIYQNYELALSEYRGKITGYSYTTFVLNDKYYYGIRRIKASKRDGKLLIEDDKMIANNFPQPPDKGVKRLTVIPLNGVDTVTTLAGKWQTNRTRQFYAISGSIELQRDNDSAHSALLAHLQELHLGPSSDATTVKVKTEPGDVKVKSDPKKGTASTKPLPPPTIPFDQRANRRVQAITVDADSISLSLYDNGVVDGDIVSVYVNGSVVMSQTKLAAQAARITIALPHRGADYELKLVAENLGLLPPNTGLLIIDENGVRHTVHFSADLQTNASITIHRKN